MNIKIIDNVPVRKHKLYFTIVFARNDFVVIFLLSRRDRQCSCGNTSIIIVGKTCKLRQARTVAVYLNRLNNIVSSVYRIDILCVRHTCTHSFLNNGKTSHLSNQFVRLLLLLSSRAIQHDGAGRSANECRVSPFDAVPENFVKNAVWFIRHNG